MELPKVSQQQAAGAGDGTLRPRTQPSRKCKHDSEKSENTHAQCVSTLGLE